MPSIVEHSVCESSPFTPPDLHVGVLRPYLAKCVLTCVASSGYRNIKLQTGFLFVSTCWSINDYELLFKGRHKLQ